MRNVKNSLAPQKIREIEIKLGDESLKVSTCSRIERDDAHRRQQIANLSQRPRNTVYSMNEKTVVCREGTWEVDDTRSLIHFDRKSCSEWVTLNAPETSVVLTASKKRLPFSLAPRRTFEFPLSPLFLPSCSHFENFSEISN